MSKNLHKFINSCVKESISEGLMFEAEWAHKDDVRIETMKYGKEHEDLLHEIGIENLDAAHREYKKCDGDFIKDKLWPYFFGKGSKEQALIAQDLAKMITDFEIGETEKEYYVVRGAAIPPNMKISDFPENTLFTYDLFSEDEYYERDDEDVDEPDDSFWNWLARQ